MKIAIPYEYGQVFQHFGHSAQFKIYDAENGLILSSEVVSTNGQGHGALVGFLVQHQVNMVLCGGIGAGAQAALAQAGIQLTNNLPLLLLCAIGATSIPRNLGSLFGGVCAQGGKKSGQIVYAAVSFVFDAALLALSTIALVGSTYNAFLYFRF